MASATTKDGDTVDLVALAHYGATAGVTEAILAANAGLAALGPVLGAGVVIELPAIPAPSTAPTIQLWD